jgi:hypothetical protein
MDPQPLPEAPKQEHIPFDVLFSLVQELASTLEEPNKALLRRIVSVLGVERTRKLLDEVLAIEAEGGRMTVDGTRRKTAGGLFLTLARAQASQAEKWKLYAFGAKPPGPDPVPANPKATPAPTLTWEEAPRSL